MHCPAARPGGRLYHIREGGSSRGHDHIRASRSRSFVAAREERRSAASLDRSRPISIDLALSPPISPNPRPGGRMYRVWWQPHPLRMQATRDQERPLRELATARPSYLNDQELPVAESEREPLGEPASSPPPPQSRAHHDGAAPNGDFVLPGAPPEHRASRPQQWRSHSASPTYSTVSAHERNVLLAPRAQSL